MTLLFSRRSIIPSSFAYRLDQRVSSDYQTKVTFPYRLITNLVEDNKLVSTGEH